MRRKTPCMEGWCGPMLSTIGSVRVSSLGISAGIALKLLIKARFAPIAVEWAIKVIEFKSYVLIIRTLGSESLQRRKAGVGSTLDLNIGLIFKCHRSRLSVASWRSRMVDHRLVIVLKIFAKNPQLFFENFCKKALIIESFPNTKAAKDPIKNGLGNFFSRNFP